MASVKEWFPHDYYASRDSRVMRLLRTGGAAWYGLYWLTVELLHCQDDLTEEDIVDALAVCSRCERRTAETFLTFALGQGLIQRHEGVIRSERVARNLAMRKDISDKKRQAASTRWGNKDKEPTGDEPRKGFTLNGGKPFPPIVNGMVVVVDDATKEYVQSMSNADAMQVQCHNKTEQNRTEEKTVVVASASQKARPRNVEDITPYFAELGMPPSEAARFFDYYTANGWKVGRNPMKDWRAAARNWRKGYTETSAKVQADAVRTAPTGIPESVIRLHQKPRVASEELERIRSIYLSKVSGDGE